ncbi:MAG: flavodoxin [Eubacterium sp.]|nr:flavodoxin [Eubacterium sp.]
MSKVSIVFWSGTGNTAMMANAIAEGVTAAGGEAVVLPVSEANVGDLKNEKAFALGCPSMGSEVLEEMEMEPFMEALEDGIAGKQIVLFGSYGWGNQEWMRDWESRITEAGATVVDGEGITANYVPGEDTLEALKDAGRSLVSLV